MNGWSYLNNYFKTIIEKWLSFYFTYCNITSYQTGDRLLQMTTKQSQYIITYDDFNDAFLCEINNETISANFVREILSYITKLYGYEPNLVYSDMEYMEVLERDLGITFRFDKSFLD